MDKKIVNITPYNNLVYLMYVFGHYLNMCVVTEALAHKSSSKVIT